MGPRPHVVRNCVLRDVTRARNVGPHHRDLPQSHACIGCFGLRRYVVGGLVSPHLQLPITEPGNWNVWSIFDLCGNLFCWRSFCFRSSLRNERAIS